MRKIYYKFDIGYAGCGEEGITFVDDNMTNDEIDQMVNDMAYEYAASWEGDESLGWSSDMSDEEYEEETQYFYDNVCGSWRFVDDEEEEYEEETEMLYRGLYGSSRFVDDEEEEAD